MSHPGDALSALLDGELTVDEADEVREHVAGCEACARELDDVREARRLVRGLPGMEPPASFVHLLGGEDEDEVVVPFAPRRRGRAVLANVGASVAAGVALLALSTSSVDPAAIDPEVDGAVARHASTVSALEAGGLLHESLQRFEADEPAPPTTAEPRSVDDLPAPYDAPAELAGYELVQAYRSDGGVHLLYRRGDYGLSVFELRGSLDWDDLPDGGTAMTVDGSRAWRWDDQGADGRLVVVERDDMVVLIVCDESGEVAMRAAGALPDSRKPPLRTRVKQSLTRALDLLTP